MAKLSALRGPWYDSTGNVLNAGLIYTYQTGSSTPQSAYDDSAGTPLSNPVVLDSNGCKTFYLATSVAYRFVIKTAGGTTVETIDDITPLTTLATSTGGADVDISGYALITSSNQDLHITPNGSGRLYLGSLKMPNAAPTTNQVLAASDATTLTWSNPNTGALQSDSNPTLSANLRASSYFISFDDTGGISDTSDKQQLAFYSTPSAVNYVALTNKTTGNGPIISAAGSDTNVVLNLNGKGTGGVTATGSFSVTGTATFNGSLVAASQNITVTTGYGIVTANGPILKANDVASAVNYVQVNSAATGDRPGIQAAGTDTNIDLELLPKGTGQVRIGGTNLPTTTGAADTTLVADGAGGSTWTDIGIYGAMARINTQTVSAVSTVMVTGISSAYSGYVLRMDHLIASSNTATVLVHLSTDGGLSVDSGSNYAFSRSFVQNGSSSLASYHTAARFEIGYLSNAAGYYSDFEMNLHDPSASKPTGVRFTGNCWNSGPVLHSSYVCGSHRTSTPVDAVQVSMSAGTITGTFTLYGIL